MKEQDNFYGYKMTPEQVRALQHQLRDDILERYDHETYYSLSIIEDFARDNKLERA